MLYLLAVLIALGWLYLLWALCKISAIADGKDRG